MNTGSSHVLVIGYGEMGHAMEFLLGDKYLLAIYDIRPTPGMPDIDFESEAARADFVLLCVPTQPIEGILQRLASVVQPHCICIDISKGLDQQGRTPAQIYQQMFADQRYGFLYGPMISEEILIGRYAFAQLGCTDKRIYDEVRSLFTGSKIYLQHSTDIAGISWSVILKNIYAIGFGIADGLQLGDNMRGYLAVTAIEELSEIVQALGGDSKTPWRLAGLGDLITTATSVGSHHHDLGCQLARGEVGNIAGEGIHTLAMIEKFSLFDITRYPLCNLIADTIRSPHNIEQRVDRYLALKCQ
jgi:glycerol-3-phosphate dehydrogenase (NAD(P)+)